MGPTDAARCQELPPSSDEYISFMVVSLVWPQVTELQGGFGCVGGARQRRGGLGSTGAGAAPRPCAVLAGAPAAARPRNGTAGEWAMAAA